MEPLRTALRFSEWALESILLPPFAVAFAIAAVSFVWAGQKQSPFKRRLWKRHHWLVLTHLLFFAAAIVVGVRWANPITSYNLPHQAVPIAKVLLDVLFYGSLASCAFWIWRMKGFRWYATSMMALAEVPVMGALLISAMSIAGAWP
jgi:hypothetical protein